MLQLLLNLEARINRATDWLGTIAAALLVMLSCLVAYNVIARYLFQASSIGLEEFSWHIYASIFLLGIPFALRHEAHVRVDIVFEKLSPKTQALIDLIGCVIFLLPFCLVVIWAGVDFASAAYSLGVQPAGAAEFFQQLFSGGIGEKSQDPGGLLNRWIIKGIIPLAFLFLLFAGLAFFIRRLNGFLNPDALITTIGDDSERTRPRGLS